MSKMPLSDRFRLVDVELPYIWIDSRYVQFGLILVGRMSYCRKLEQQIKHIKDDFRGHHGHFSDETSQPDAITISSGAQCSSNCLPQPTTCAMKKPTDHRALMHNKIPDAQSKGDPLRAMKRCRQEKTMIALTHTFVNAIKNWMANWSYAPSARPRTWKRALFLDLSRA